MSRASFYAYCKRFSDGASAPGKPAPAPSSLPAAPASITPAPPPRLAPSKHVTAEFDHLTVAETETEELWGDPTPSTSASDGTETTQPDGDA